MTAICRRDGRSERLGSFDGIPALRGLHNMQNALTAIALAAAVTPELPIADHIAACRSFPGLAHRLQPVGRIGDVLFVNDSKATNADSTEKALASFPGGIYWILGGRAKAGGITPLEAYFPRIARAFLIGEASDEFAATLEGKVAYERCGRLDVAVARAAEAAVADQCTPGHEKVVLLSPACASFDQFPDFEVRGQAFVDIVRRLERARGGG
jgi:UDP-N-acetylmuramoylalanine--D-glutamate ligase